MDRSYERPRRTHTSLAVDYDTRDMLREIADSEAQSMAVVLKRWVHAEYAKRHPQQQPAAPA